MAASQLDAMNAQAWAAANNSKALESQYLGAALGGITDAAQTYANYRQNKTLSDALTQYGNANRGPASGSGTNP
jgi:hypothetical protein